MDLVRELSGVRLVSQKQFEVGLHRVAFSLRPYGKKGAEFTDFIVPARDVALFVQRRQYLEKDGKLVRSCPTMAFRPRHNVVTGEITFDSRGCMEAYDIALPPSKRNAPNFLNVQENRRTARLASQMFKMVQNAQPHHLVAEPPMPSFYFGFHKNRPPKFEVSTALKTAAVQMASSIEVVGCSVDSWEELLGVLRRKAESGGASEDSVSKGVEHLVQEVLKTTWNSYLRERNGMILVPQVFLYRPTKTYEKHPILGTEPPTATPRKGDAVDGWAEVSGYWVPQAQRPDQIFVDVSSYVGVYRRNMAYRVFLNEGLISDPTFEDFRNRLRSEEELERFRSRFQNMSDEQIEHLKREFIRAMGSAANTATESDIGEAFLSPHNMMWHSLANRIVVVDLADQPSRENLVFTRYGLKMDVYRARDQWQPRFESYVHRDRHPHYVG